MAASMSSTAPTSPFRSSAPRPASPPSTTSRSSASPAATPRGTALYYKALARLAARSDRVIVPSNAVAADAFRFLGIRPDRVVVIPEAARAGLSPATPDAVDDLCRRLAIDRPYLLCVGTGEAGKRAIDAIRALSFLHEQRIDAQLVLAGNAGRLTLALQHQAQILGLYDSVKFVGYVPDADLSALYTGAAALLFPSLYEGFGLPPLEAMACGTPVITTSAPAMTEVLGDAALYAPLRNPRAIAELAGPLLTDDSVRREWSERGTEHVRQYSWARAAAETAAVYWSVAK